MIEVNSFIDWAFYGDIIGKPVNTVQNSYDIYCKLFGYDELDRKELQKQICECCNAVIDKGYYKSC